MKNIILSKTPTRIWLDMDGVLFNYLKAALHTLNNSEFPIDSITSHEYLSILKITKEEEHSLIDAAGPEFWENLELLPKAEELINAVHNTNIPYGILTNPGSFTYATEGKCRAIRKLSKINKGIPIIFAKEKHHHVRPGELLIDDYADNCLKLTPGAYHICPTRPWNNIQGLNRLPDEDIISLLRALTIQHASNN